MSHTNDFVESNNNKFNFEENTYQNNENSLN